MSLQILKDHDLTEQTNDNNIDIEHDLGNPTYKYMHDEEIDQTILRERNEGMRKLAEDMDHLSEISLSLKELVYEQSEPLEIVEQNIENTQENITEASEHLKNAESYASKFKSIFARGALVSTGVTGAGAATGIFLNPIAGGLAVVVGVGGIVYCLLQM